MCALASEPADTAATARQLGEIVVTARQQSASAAATTYTHTAAQKRTAQTAIDLLRQMAIPQIRINPIDGAVSDNAGGSVALYINYLEAGKDELAGLRTADVRRVEYLEFPTDPRFGGAQRVINIIVHQYAYGGYTKAAASTDVLAGLAGHADVYSKFSYKKMTFDLYAGADMRDWHHAGSYTKGIYRLIGDDSKEYTLHRSETPVSSRHKEKQYPITVRATYSSDRIRIRNLLAFTNSGTPANEYSGTLAYSPDRAEGYSFDRKNPGRSNMASYSGSYYFELPENITLDITPSVNYTHSNDYTDYVVSGREPIHRHAKEDACNYRVNLYIRKRFGQQHSLMLGGNGGDNIHHLKYTGDNTYRDRFHNAFAAAMAGYNFRTQKISLNIDAGAAWENSDINGSRYSDTYPFAHVNVRYAANQKNSFSAYLQYATNSPGISQKSTDILQENELMYISGNPQLKNSRHATVNLAYTWLPSNTIGLSAYGSFFDIFDRQLLVYTPYHNGKALLRSYINDGDYISARIGISVNCRLLDGKLQLYANPCQTFYKSTGIYNQSCNPFGVTAQANYYLDSFYFQIYYESPRKTMYMTSPRISRSRNFHSATIGWANANWNLRIMAANIFNKGWDDSRITIHSPYYSERQTITGTAYHPRINFSATYTFGYGKKVERGNEVGRQAGTASAILK